MNISPTLKAENTPVAAAVSNAAPSDAVDVAAAAVVVVVAFSVPAFRSTRPLVNDSVAANAFAHVH